MTSPPEAVLQARILLVDDEEANLAVLTAQLSREGYTALTAVSDPREVVPVCVAALPDLILLDLHMPYLDGFAVLAQLQTIVPPDCYLPILVLTADISMEVRHRALQAGAHDFVTKPFDRTEVLLRVRNLLHTRALYRAQAQRHQTLAELSAELTAILSADGLIQYASPSFDHSMGRSPDALLGTRLTALVHPDDQPAFEAALVQCRDERDAVSLPAHRVARSTSSGEDWRIVEGSVVNRLNDPTVCGLIVTARDVTERTLLHDQVRQDRVTHLPNQARFQEILATELASGPSPESPFALVLVACGGITEALAARGPAAADQLLQEAARRLSTLCRPEDTLARTGDARFALLLPRVGTGGAVWAARRILAVLAPPVLVDGVPLLLIGAAGIVLSPDHRGTPDAFERAAGLALATAVTSPAGYCLYTASQEQQAVRQRALVADLREAVARKELVLYYQPKLHLHAVHGGIVGVEALVRWRHPQRGLIPPDEFIGLAEQHGLIDGLTLWVLETALRRCRLWQWHGRTLDVAVNLSMRSLTNRAMPHVVAGLLRRFGVPPRMLVLEVTESALMTDPERTLAVLTQLAALGVRLSVDDFGTGYSSLAHLRRYPVSELKIDRSFVTEMASVEHDRAVVETVISLGKKLNLVVVAEGVEQQDTLTLLTTMGCPQVQGYHISRPLPEGELLTWLDTSPWSLPHRPW